MTTRDEFIANFQSAYGTDEQAAQEAWEANQEHTNASPEETMNDDNTETTHETEPEPENAHGTADKAKARRRALRGAAPELGTETTIARGRAALGAIDDALNRAGEYRDWLRQELAEVDGKMRAVMGVGGDRADGDKPEPAFNYSVLNYTATPARKPRAAPSTRRPKSTTSKPRAEKAPRLKRRNEAELRLAASQVVACVKQSGDEGMRSEKIRAELKLDKREMPSILKYAREAKLLRSKGEKRAMTWFATAKA